MFFVILHPRTNVDAEGRLIYDIGDAHFWSTPPDVQPYVEILEVKIKIQGVYGA